MNEEKAEEPDIQLPTSSGSLKNQEGSRKTSTSALLTITSRQIDRETMETVTDFILVGVPKALQMVTAALKLKDACSLEEKL